MRFSADRRGGKTPYKRKTAYSAVFQWRWGGIGGDRELCAAYVKHFKPINNEITNAVGKDLTDKFTVDFLKFDKKTELKLYDCFRFAIVLEGKGVIENSEQKVEIKKGDMMFISADTPDLSVTACGELVMCY